MVPQSGIAGLLKRVVGERIEQRRKAVRARAQGARQRAARRSAELLSPASRPSRPPGKDRITVSGVSVVTGTGLRARQLRDRLERPSRSVAPSRSARSRPSR